MRCFKKYLIFIALLIAVLPCTMGQDPLQGETAEIDNDLRREEIQRYFGYEMLPFRYLSLPYDVSINVNEHGSFVDIGFLYLLFLPLLILLLVSKNKWLSFGFFAAIVFFWVISTSNSFVFSESKGKVPSQPQDLQNYLGATNPGEEPLAFAIAQLYSFSRLVYEPVEFIFKKISGDADYITYPLLFSFFLFLSLLIQRRISSQSLAVRILFVLCWVYSFFWFAFSAGIIWYGYVILYLALVSMYFLFGHARKVNNTAGNVLEKSFYSLALIWVFMAIILRISNIQTLAMPEYAGKGMYNPVFYSYGIGEYSENQALDRLFPNLQNALEKINSEKESLILRIGTSFTYFINNNADRVIVDNQLGLFYSLKRKYEEDSVLTDVLKASNIKYIIVDLNTAQIDRTPEKSLTEKYTQLMYFLYQNPKLEMIGTDRILTISDETDNNQYIYGVFGQVQNFGRYAIFEIL